MNTPSTAASAPWYQSITHKAHVYLTITAELFSVPELQLQFMCKINHSLKMQVICLQAGILS